MAPIDPLLSPALDDDPFVTRLIPCHRSDAPASCLLDDADGVSTSLSIVVPCGGEPGVAQVLSLSDWHPPQIRMELLVTDNDADGNRTAMRERLAGSGRTWRFVERPAGGRAAALSSATEAAEHEFLAISTGEDPPLELVTSALSLMWSEGGDVSLIGRQAEEDVDGDPSATLASWLGLASAQPTGRLVVMRRWVARWLFNQLTRSISPSEEVADRARLLGIGIIQLSP